MAAHRIPYAATVSIADPDEFDRILRTALRDDGLSIPAHPFPLSHRLEERAGADVNLVRLAVNSGLFPLYEVFDGERYRVNYELDDTDPAQYYEGQGRFHRDEIDLDAVRDEARRTHQRLLTLAEAWPARDDE